MKSMILFFSFVSLVSFCSMDDDPQNAAEIIGKWRWTESSGGFAGKTETPKSTGKEIILEFTAEKYSKFVNGVLEAEMSYKIEIGKSIRTSENTNLIIYENGQKQSIEITGNKLILYDEYYDGFQYEYIKE